MLTYPFHIAQINPWVLERCTRTTAFQFPDNIFIFQYAIIALYQRQLIYFRLQSIYGTECRKLSKFECLLDYVAESFFTLHLFMVDLIFNIIYHLFFIRVRGRELSLAKLLNNYCSLTFLHLKFNCYVFIICVSSLCAVSLDPTRSQGLQGILSFLLVFSYGNYFIRNIFLCLAFVVSILSVCPSVCRL